MDAQVIGSYGVAFLLAVVIGVVLTFVLRRRK